MTHDRSNPATDDLTEQARRLQQAAAELQVLRRWAEATALAARAASLLAAQPDAPAVGRACHALAGTLDDLGDHAAAETLYRRAGAILSTLPTGGPDDSLRIHCARGLAASMRVQHRDREAHALLVATHALAEQLLGPSDAETLATMTAIGLLCEGLGRDDEAEDLYRQALRRSGAGAGRDPNEEAGIAAALSCLLERRARGVRTPSVRAGAS